MRRTRSSQWVPAMVCVASIACVALAPRIGAAAAPELVLQRVMLSAGGVGYFEYEATVEGDTTLELSVRLDQVDDVLKSIVVYDDRGAAGTIRLAGRNPVEEIFRDLPFGPAALDSPVALLNALPGAVVRARGQRAIEGRLVRVVPETQALPAGGGSVTRHRVSVMTAAGLETFILEEADAIRFTDPALSAQIDQALTAVSEHRTRDRRTLHVVSTGSGRRAVRVGYVVSAPLWKASYRLSVGDGDTARLQGWAVLENMSGRDWNGVELTLVSGNPVTFRQALYAAYYADRPQIPVEVLGRVLPAPDTGAIETGRGDRARLRAPAAPRRSAGLVGADAALGRAEGKAALSAAPAEERAFAAADMAGAPATLAPATQAPATQAPATQAPATQAPPAQARVLAAASTEAATSVNFRIPYPVSVDSGQSLLVPVIDRAVPAERVSLFQPETHPRHPLAAVRLVNDGESGLPPGVLTLYETAPAGTTFIGDARLAPLPVGEERLVSYALDQKTTVDRETEGSQTIATGRIVDGVLELSYAQRQRTVYRVQAPAAAPRTLLIEHPRTPGWILEEPDPGSAKLTARHFRITRAIGAGASDEIPVVVGRPLLQRIELVQLPTAQLARYAATGELDPALRKAFEGMALLSRDVDAEQRRLEEIERARALIHQEQGRLRDNLSRVPRDSDLHKRYLRKLAAQEDRLERLLGDAERSREALEGARAALADYIRGLDV